MARICGNDSETSVVCKNETAICLDVQTEEEGIEIVKGQCFCAPGYEDISGGNYSVNGDFCAPPCVTGFCANDGQCLRKDDNIAELYCE
ncbi:hypothetical protein SK128_024509 [Halocaridina rubra]|uniref:Uncharacterized protein n=1 Tax=Halocaridina rubra TaxID=373956 RepID=A0AAN8ZZP2_HALRR